MIFASLAIENKDKIIKRNIEKIKIGKKILDRLGI